MASLSATLAVLSAVELRGIATRLALRTETQTQKIEWITTITAYWQQPDSQTAGVQRLSPAARRALWWLCHAPSVPADPFWFEFGDVRRARARQPGQPTPWQQPATAAEELFYSGLLHAQRPTPVAKMPTPTLAKARQLMLPTPLRHALAELVASAAPSLLLDDALLDRAQLPAAMPQVLLHDLGQYLIYLHQARIQEPAALRLLYNRWLPPRHLRAVASRLLHPQASRALRSHKSNPWLCLLAFLATAAALQDGGQLTASGWAWLAAPPSRQLERLWHGWQESEWDLRAAYAQADAPLPLPWPGLLTTALATVHAPFMPATLAAHLLSQEQISAVYWNLSLERLQQLVDLLTMLCATLLTPLGIVTPTTPTNLPDSVTPPHAISYALTPLGKELAHSDTITASPSLPPTTATLFTAPVSPAPENPAFPITIAFPIPPSSIPPSPASLHPQATIAGFADYAGRQGDAHHYQLTTATLARAAAAGLGLATLATALEAVNIALTPSLWQQLQAGYAQGQQLQLQPATLLRTHDADQLAALHQQRPLAALFAEILTPTTALLGVDAIRAQAALQTHGFYAQSPYPDETLTPAAPAAKSSASGVSVELQQNDREVLWLAGQLYRLLADQLPLPVPLAAEPLQALYATLPPTSQATLAAQHQRMAEQLGSLLDNLPFTPPLEPSDPAQWIPIIDAALATQEKGHAQLLQMTYFSAGRNLTTQRIVEPYWRETHRGNDYLRGYCHSAGRVLIFRLDRVQALAVMRDD